MAPSITGTPQAFAFTTSGTVVTYTGGGTANASTYDVLCVNSDNVVTTPSGWTSIASRVNSQGSYIFARNGGTTSATLDLGGGIASNTSALWVRITDAGGVDSGATNTAGADGSSGTSTPSVTSGALSASTELALAFAALHNNSSGSLATGWSGSSGYTVAISGTAGTAGSGSGVAGAVATKAPAGTAAESPTISWTNAYSDRYILVVAFTAAATGTDYTRTVDDSTGQTDAASVTSAFGRAQTDASGLTDTIAVAAAFTRTVSDTVGLTDATAPQLSSGFTRTVDDPAGLTDAPGSAAAHARAVTDGAGTVDSASVAEASGRTAADSAGLADSVTTELAGAGARVVDDLAGLTDSVTYSSALARTDELGLADAVTIAATLARTLADSAGPTDAVLVALSRAVTVTDPAGLSDQASAVTSTGNAYTRTVTDSIGLTSWHRSKQTTPRTSAGTTVRPFIGVTSRHPLIPD